MRRGRVVLLVGATVVVGAVALARHGRRHAGRETPAGILISSAGVYDALSRLAFRSFFTAIADDVVRTVPEGSKVLEIGCGPGLLSIDLARRGLAVTGLDLDPAMIDRARRNALAAPSSPSFVVGDVGSLGFPDGAFDAVVSTLSLHHWSDPGRGLAEIARVLRPGGRALVWDVRPGRVPLHPVADPAEALEGSSLRIADERRWRWPWRFELVSRYELVDAAA